MLSFLLKIRFYVYSPECLEEENFNIEKTHLIHALDIDNAKAKLINYYQEYYTGRDKPDGTELQGIRIEDLTIY